MWGRSTNELSSEAQTRATLFLKLNSLPSRGLWRVSSALRPPVRAASSAPLPDFMLPID
jgi:hypothetical protein